MSRFPAPALRSTPPLAAAEAGPVVVPTNAIVVHDARAVPGSQPIAHAAPWYPPSSANHLTATSPLPEKPSAGGGVGTVAASLSATQLIIHAARYGFRDEIWWPHACTLDTGVRDVTAIVRALVFNNELHINPARRPGVLNDQVITRT